MAYLKIYIVYGHSADQGNITTQLAAACHHVGSLVAALCFLGSLGQLYRSDLAATRFESVTHEEAYTHPAIRP